MEVVPSSEDVPESMDVEEEPPEKEIGLNKVMETRVEEEDTEAARSSTEPTQVSLHMVLCTLCYHLVPIL